MLLPQSDARLREAQADFEAGEITIDDLQEHFEEAAAISQSHREALVRSRRSMLDVNTAVGMRILP